jgi:hypothetical protein
MRVRAPISHGSLRGKKIISPSLHLKYHGYIKKQSYSIVRREYTKHNDTERGLPFKTKKKKKRGGGGIKETKHESTHIWEMEMQTSSMNQMVKLY